MIKRTSPGQSCQTAPLESWTPPEKWVWLQVCEGKIADFNDLHGDLDPRNASDWSDDRLISPVFLETILLHDPFQSTLPYHGVRIAGAWIKESIDLQQAPIACQLWLEKSRFDEEVELSCIHSNAHISFQESFFATKLSLNNAKVEGVLNMCGAKFRSSLHMNSIVVEQGLFMRDKAKFTEVELVGAKIGGQLSMHGSTFTGLLQMNSVEVDGSLLMSEGAEFARVELSNAKVSDQLNIAGTTYTDCLNMNGIEVGQNLFMNDGAEFLDKVDLSGAKIAGQIEMQGSRFKGLLKMVSVKVDGSLLMGKGVENKGSEFTEVILTNSKIGDQLNMAGATFSGSLGMNNLEIIGDLFMRDQAEFKDIDLSGAKIGNYVDMHSSKFRGALEMVDIEIGRNLLMSEGAEFESIDLSSGKVGGYVDMHSSEFMGSVNMNGFNAGDQVNMHRSKFKEPLSMNGLKVGQSLAMSYGAEFSSVDLTGAKIAHQVDMQGSRFTGQLQMNSLETGDSLLMCNGAEFARVDLDCAKIGNQIDMCGSRFTGPMHMGSLVVARNLLMGYGAKFNGNINLVYAHIGSGLDLSSGEFSLLNLNGTHVDGELRLGSKEHDKPVWNEGSKLILRDTVVNTVHDSGEDDAWPKNLVLNGYKYNHLGGSYGDDTGSGGKGMTSRKLTWFINWLASDPIYAPQPYHHLAGVLRSMGHATFANAILYAGRERERSEATGLNRCWLSLLKWVIGYGYHYFYAFLWVVTFTLVGAWVYSTIPSDYPKSLPELIGFSFDLILPLVELDGDKHKIDFDGPQRYYFYVHKLIGYTLGFFVIAGLSGITEK